MTATDGRQTLSKALKEPGRSQSWLAKQIGVTQIAVSSWVRGVSRPAFHHRHALFHLLGISPDSWMTAKERRVAETPPGTLAKAG